MITFMTGGQAMWISGFLDLGSFPWRSNPLVKLSQLLFLLLYSRSSFGDGLIAKQNSSKVSD